MKQFLFLSLLIFNSTLFSQKTNPENFIQKGWKIIKKIEGDLNKDQIKDVALIIEEDNKANLKTNESLGVGTLNLNPRGIIILFKDKSKYTKVLENYSFIPSESNEESPCLSDPLLDGGIDIENGILIVSLKYWYSCGSWYTNIDSYKFRYQENKFKLIGLDVFEMHRASGDATETSINFLTKKKKTTTGLNEFNESNPKVKWEVVKTKELYNLNESFSSEDINNLLN